MQKQRTWYKEGLFALALTGVLSFGQAALPTVALADETGGETIAGSVEQNNNDTQSNDTQTTPATTPSAPAETPVVTAPAPAPTTPDNATPSDPQTNDNTDVLQAPATDGTENDTTPAVDEGLDTINPGPVEENTPFYIESGASGNEAQVLDAKGGKTANGTNIQTYKLNKSAAQQYEFEKAIRQVLDEMGNVTGTEDDVDEEGNIFYWIKRAGTEQVLTVVNNIGKKGANVALYEKDVTLDGQKWRVEDCGNGLYSIISKLTMSDGSALAIDIAGGKKANGTNIQVWKYNKSQAQRFALLSTTTPVSTAAPLESGVYTVAANGDTSLVSDVAAGSKDDGANLRLWTSNGTAAQSIVVTADDDGYYILGILGSGKVFDVAGGSSIPGTNVRQWTYNGTDAQKWALQKNADGSYSFVNKKNGLYLNITDGSISSGANLRVYRNMGTGSAAQEFALTRIAKCDTNVLGVGDDVTPTSIFTITPAGNNSFVFDVNGGSNQSGASIQLWAGNDSLAQRFQVELTGNNEYRIRTAASGDYLSEVGVEPGSQVAQLGEPSTWKVVWDKAGYFVLQNDFGHVLEVAGGNYAKGTAIVTSASISNALKQHFVFTKADLVAESCYYVNTISGTTLDVESASTADGANIRLYTSNNSTAQRFNLVKVGNYYQLVNVNSGKAMTAGTTVIDDGCNAVTQETKDTTNNYQLWKITVGTEGYVEFLNVATKKNLFSRGGDMASGDDVQAKYLLDKSIHDNHKGRSWKLVIATGWYKKNGHWYYTSDDSRAHFDMDYDSKGKSTGNYDILYTIWRYVNGVTSGSYKPFYSKTGYLICSSWDSCYIGIFKGKAKITTKNSYNWQPLLGLNCANGLPSKIEAQARIDKPGSTWKWDPNWDKNLGEGNANIKNLPDSSKWAYYLGYKAGQSTAKGSYNWIHSRKAKVTASERWFTSVSTTLGYHTYTGKESAQVGRHLSYGCQRIAEKYAKWIYENIGPGTRCLQRTNKRLKSGK